MRRGLGKTLLKLPLEYYLVMVIFVGIALTISTLSTTYPDSSDTQTYSLVTGTGDTDYNAFTIDPSSLMIKSSPDYEINPLTTSA